MFKFKLSSLSIAVALLAGLMAAGPARAQEAFAGNWTISKSDRAPWAATVPPSDAEARMLTGKPVSFLPKRIDGPKQVGCGKLEYEIKSYAPDMLFQGGLTDPPKQAAALGFKGTAIKTLETGCGSEIDFHMVDPDTVLFGLNDRIYTLTRSK
jgi:hypothetical protein